MQLLTDPQAWIAFLALLSLELVLGIDNIIFISILAEKLPGHQRQTARLVGLGLAMFTRILLLFSLSWVIRLTSPLFSIFQKDISGRDLILILGGLFLLAKSTFEIHESLEGEPGHASAKAKAAFVSIIIQILLLDVVFSLDSVITAVGMVDQLAIMIAAVVCAVIFMMMFSAPLSSFVAKHPTIKMLALSFLLLIGLSLFAEGFGVHLPKGYVYFAMGFSVFVEMLNLRLRKKRQPVELHERYEPGNKR